MAEYEFVKDQKKVYEQLPANTYECIIDKMEYGQTPKGKQYLRVSMKIREDVASNTDKYRGWHIFETLWYNEETKQYSFYTLQNLVNSQPREEDKIQFNTIEDIIRFLTGACLKVKVEYASNKNLETEQKRRYYATDYKAITQEKQPSEDLTAPFEDVEEPPF